MLILTSYDVEQKRVTQIIQISKIAALEQRSAITFCGANKKSRQETFEMLKTPFGNNATKKTASYKWYSKFEQGNDSVTDEPGRPSSISTKEIETVKELLNSDRWMAIRDITIRTGYTFGTLFRIIHNELGMRTICAIRCCFAFRFCAMIEYMLFGKRGLVCFKQLSFIMTTPSHRAAQTTKTIKRLGFELFRPPLSIE